MLNFFFFKLRVEGLVDGSARATHLLLNLAETTVHQAGIMNSSLEPFRHAPSRRYPCDRLCERLIAGLAPKPSLLNEQGDSLSSDRFILYAHDAVIVGRTGRGSTLRANFECRDLLKVVLSRRARYCFNFDQLQIGKKKKALEGFQ